MTTLVGVINDHLYCQALWHNSPMQSGKKASVNRKRTTSFGLLEEESSTSRGNKRQRVISLCAADVNHPIDPNQFGVVSAAPDEFKRTKNIIEQSLKQKDEDNLLVNGKGNKAKKKGAKVLKAESKKSKSDDKSKTSVNHKKESLQVNKLNNTVPEVVETSTRSGRTVKRKSFDIDDIYSNSVSSKPKRGSRQVTNKKAIPVQSEIVVDTKPDGTKPESKGKRKNASKTKASTPVKDEKVEEKSSDVDSGVVLDMIDKIKARRASKSLTKEQDTVVQNAKSKGRAGKNKKDNPANKTPTKSVVVPRTRGRPKIHETKNTSTKSTTPKKGNTTDPPTRRSSRTTRKH